MKKNLSLILILVFSVVLRFYHNTLISMWHDEAFSALMIRYPWREMFYRLGLDVHPPMFYIFLRLWHYLFGDSLLSLRGFSILFGVGTSVSGYLFVKEAFKNKKAALLAALLIAINPFQLQYVTEARMYTMGAFFALLAGYFLVKALNKQKELAENINLNQPHNPQISALKKNMIWSYVGFTLSMIVLIYTHYYLFFTAAALGFYGLVFLLYHFYRRNGGKIRHSLDFRWLLSSFAIIVISFLPWLKVFLFQYRQVGASYWIPPINIWSMPSTFWDMLLGFERDTTKHSTQVLLILVTLFSLYLLYRFLRKTNSPHKWLVVLAIIAPFCGAILFEVMAKLKGSSSSVYQDRYFLFASVYFSIAVAMWLEQISLKWLSASLIIVYCILNFYAYVHYWQQLNVKTKPGMAAAAKFLQNNVTPNDKIYVGTSYEFFNFKYYWTKKPDLVSNSNLFADDSTGYQFVNNVRPLLFTGGRTNISQISSVEGVALLSNNDLGPDFSKDANSGDLVWVVWTNGFGSSKPQTPKNWAQIDEKAYAEVRPWVGTNIYVTEYRVN